MSKNIDLNLIQMLSQLGFSEKEASVYIALQIEGEVSAIQVSKDTQLHRQFVYNALASLKERGLVTQIGEVRSRWRAENPRKLIAHAEEQERQAAIAAEALLSLQQKKKGQEFEIVEGIKAYRSRVLDVIRDVPPKSTILMISGEGARYRKLAGEIVYKEWERIRIAKEIQFRIIGPESLKTSLAEATAKRKFIEYRTLPGLEENLVNTVTYSDRVDFEIYGEPHVTFSIKNRDVAESQRKFFEALWQMPII